MRTTLSLRAAHDRAFIAREIVTTHLVPIEVISGDSALYPLAVKAETALRRLETATQDALIKSLEPKQ